MLALWSTLRCYALIHFARRPAAQELHIETHLLHAPGRLKVHAPKLDQGPIRVGSSRLPNEVKQRCSCCLHQYAPQAAVCKRRARLLQSG